MNYYDARQNSQTLKWKYVMIGRDSTYSVGYCAGDKCQRHDTKEEAQEHQKQYILDTKLRFFNQANTQKKCKICGEWTQGCAELDFQIFYLCEKHQTKEFVSELYGNIGECWSSY